MKTKVSIVLPARNEEQLIKNCLVDIYKFLDSKNYGYEILVVVNGSTDNTEEIVKSLSSKNKNIKLINSKSGYGQALKKGMQTAVGDYIVIFNVDFYDLNMLDLVDIDLYGKDFVIGSKMAHWSTDKRPILRRIVSTLFNIYLKMMFGFKGSDTHGIKIMKRSVIDAVLKKCKTVSGIVDTEFVIRAQKLGFKFADVPVYLEEVRLPRFINRLSSTPIDIYNLHKSLI